MRFLKWLARLPVVAVARFTLAVQAEMRERNRRSWDEYEARMNARVRTNEEDAFTRIMSRRNGGAS